MSAKRLRNTCNKQLYRCGRRSILWKLLTLSSQSTSIWSTYSLVNLQIGSIMSGNETTSNRFVLVRTVLRFRTFWWGLRCLKDVALVLVASKMVGGNSSLILMSSSSALSSRMISHCLSLEDRKKLGQVLKSQIGSCSTSFKTAILGRSKQLRWSQWRQEGQMYVAPLIRRPTKFTSLEATETKLTRSLPRSLTFWKTNGSVSHFWMKPRTLLLLWFWLTSTYLCSVGKLEQLRIWIWHTSQCQSRCLNWILNRKRASSGIWSLYACIFHFGESECWS